MGGLGIDWGASAYIGGPGHILGGLGGLGIYWGAWGALGAWAYIGGPGGLGGLGMYWGAWGHYQPVLCPFITRDRMPYSLWVWVDSVSRRAWTVDERWA